MVPAHETAWEPVDGCSTKDQMPYQNRVRGSLDRPRGGGLWIRGGPGAALRGADGTVLSAQVSTGDAVVLLGPAMADFGSCAVPDPSWASSRVFVYVDDVDAHHDRSRAGGATIVSEPADHGPNRIYLASDCGGQQWIFATPIG